MSHRNSMIECHIEFEGKNMKFAWYICLLWTILERCSVQEKSTDVVVYDQSFLLIRWRWNLSCHNLFDVCCLWHLPSFVLRAVVKVQVYCLGKRQHWLKFVKILKFYLSHRVIVNLIGGVDWVELYLLAWFSLLLLLVDHNPLPDDHNKEQDEDHCS